MSLDGVGHVEALALIKGLAEPIVRVNQLIGDGMPAAQAIGDLPPMTTVTAALGWCEANAPDAEDYVAAVASLRQVDGG
jgi:hypothetical protein